MNLYAQTNIQLYDQLLTVGYSKSDLKCVRDGYELASQLVSAKFRANGKPEIAHLVGTASILAAHGASLSTVLAGLLHNAYKTGDFGSFWPRRMTMRKRRLLRRVIGREAEALVAHYSLSQWNSHNTAQLAKALPELSEREHCVLLIRLSNELEEAADLFCDHELRRQRKINQLSDYIEIAQNINRLDLADELQEAYAASQSRQVSAELTATHLETYHSPPLSYRRGLIPAISYGLRLVWRRFPVTLRSRFRKWAEERALKMD